MKLYIRNSYKVKTIESISIKVIEFYNNGQLDKDRTVDAYVKKWFAYNWLYNNGLFTSSTKDIELNSKDSIFEEFIYNIIYKFFK